MHVKSAEAKRRQVLQASANVFRTHGYARTTMGDLAKAAGMSRPALYLVFPRKQQVFCSLLDELSADGVTAEHDRSYPAMIAWLLWACGLWTGEDRLIATTEEAGRLSEKAEEYLLIARLLQEGIARRLPPEEGDAPAEDIARLIAAVMRGLCDAPLPQAERKRLLSVQVRGLVETAGWARRARAEHATASRTLM